MVNEVNRFYIGLYVMLALLGLVGLVLAVAQLALGMYVYLASHLLVYNPPHSTQLTLHQGAKKCGGTARKTAQDRDGRTFEFLHVSRSQLHRLFTGCSIAHPEPQKGLQLQYIIRPANQFILISMVI